MIGQATGLLKAQEGLASDEAFQRSCESRRTHTVNADLVDDPEELARTIEEASGAAVEIVSESEVEGPDA